MTTTTHHESETATMNPSDYCHLTYNEETGQHHCDCGAPATATHTVDFGTTYYRCTATDASLGGSGL